MTPQLQLFKHDPDNGVYGDCWRSSLACVLDLPVEMVPHFADGSFPPETWSARTDRWLAGLGLIQVSVPFVSTDYATLMQFAGSRSPGNHYLVTAETERGILHTVICKDDAEVWNTSLEPSPFKGPCDDGYWWVTYLGKRLP